MEKPLECFTKDKIKKDGHKNICKECSRNALTKWVSENPEKANQIALKSYHERKTLISQRRKELRQQDPKKYREQAKATRLKNLFHYQCKNREASWKRAGIIGMTYAIYEKMLEEQNHRCAVCQTHQSMLGKNLGVDHDHLSGKPRGLLCDACNRAIGYLKESRVLFQSAIEYLDHYEK